VVAPKTDKSDKSKSKTNGKEGDGDDAHAAPLEFASKNDYQLTQAVNLLKALQVIKK